MSLYWRIFAINAGLVIAATLTLAMSPATVSSDLLTREVKRGEVTVELQAREFSLLEFLMRHAGRVVTKTMILEHVWDYSFDPQTNVVDVLVCRLRNKIDKDKQMLHTLRGVGYVLRPA